VPGSLTRMERRSRRTEFRDVPGSNGRQKWATAVAYNVADDFGTLWLPGVFDASLATRMPTILYGHVWEDIGQVVGAGIDFRQTPAEVGPPGVDVLFEFADPADVEAARLAMVLTSPQATSRGAILQDMSVGFVREQWLTRDKLTPEQLAAGASEAMQQAGMDELSIVVRGAVPGAQMRGRRAGIDLDAVVELARRKAAGEITDAEAQAAIALLEAVGHQAPAGGDPAASGAPSGDDAPAPEGDAADLAALEAAADAALASIGRSRR